MADWETLLSNAKCRVQCLWNSIADGLCNLGKEMIEIATNAKDDISDIAYSVKHRAHLRNSLDNNQKGKTYEIVFPVGKTEINYLNTRLITSSQLKKVINIIFPNNLKKIGQATFLQCENIKKIVLPKSIEEVQKGAFHPNTRLHIYYTTKNQGTWDPHKDQIIQVMVDESVKEIKDKAFFQYTRLSSVTLNDGLKRIGKEAFKGTALLCVTIPSSVKSIGENAFKDCACLKTFTLPTYYKNIDLSKQPLYKKIYDKFNKDYYKDFDSLNNEKQEFDNNYEKYTKLYLGLSDDCTIQHPSLIEEFTIPESPIPA